MPNIRILAQGVLKISCIQDFSIVIIGKSLKGHNSFNASWNLLISSTGHINIDLSHMLNIRILAQVAIKILC